MRLARRSEEEAGVDFQARVGGQTIASEAECSAKTLQRLLVIMHGLARTYAGVWYFCPPVLMEPMQQTFAHLDPAVRRKFALRPVP